MSNAWKRIDQWLAKNSAKVASDLQGGAREADFAEAESVLGIKLPDQVRSSYRIHNGQEGGVPPLAGSWVFLSLEDMVGQWKLQKKLLDTGKFADNRATAKGPVRAEWWNEKWIPFAYNGSGNLLCADLDPAERGKPGQVVAYVHDAEVRECVAESVDAWFEQLASEMEAGKYVVINGRVKRA
jgi:cell wall assembly regulator SMI1